MKQTIMNIINLLLKLLGIDAENSSPPQERVQADPDIEQPETPNESAPSIQEVIKKLQELEDEFEDETECDPRAVFTFTYLHITKTIQEGLTKQKFKDPRWVAELDKKFADLYFEAIDDFDSNSPSKSKVWAKAFEAIGAGRTKDKIPIPAPAFTILKAKIVPMIAHITHDLPIALCDLKANYSHSPPEDYEIMNSLLIGQIGPIQQIKADRYSLQLRELDKFGLDIDEWLTSIYIPLLRQRAWDDAINLCSDETYAETIKKNTCNMIDRVISHMDSPGTEFISLFLGLLTSH